MVIFEVTQHLASNNDTFEVEDQRLLYSSHLLDGASSPNRFASAPTMPPIDPFLSL